MRPRHGIIAIFLAVLLADVAFALGPDELALVVNRNVPEGRVLAELYAKTRGVPSDRIIELDLSTTEEMTFDAYEQQCTPPIRKFLRDHQLEGKVNCLVTFWGVPLKIAGRVNSSADDAEAKMLRDELPPLMRRADALAAKAEALAKQANSQFKPFDAPRNAIPLGVVQMRIEGAIQTIALSIQNQTDPAARQKLLDQAIALNRELNEPAFPVTQPATAPADNEPDAPMELAERHFSPAAREKLRRFARSQAMLTYLQLLAAQADYFDTDQTDAATDNELALLWWPSYMRKQWQINPLYYRVPPQPPGRPRTVMVCRIDGPDINVARRIIEESLKVEQTGLQGGVVLDSRGIPQISKTGAPDGYGVYDEKLRSLAAFLKLKPKLPLTFDEKPDVLPAGSCKDVAIYWGWYSLRNYVPACTLNPGAVAIHIASFELTTLRSPGTKEWVANLLKNGADASFGPVSEPFLHSFPGPDDFVPLLLTGKLTLAEVYWRTCPLTSWKIALIGDPLYTPYKVNPQLEVRELPTRLQAIFDAAPAAQPRNN